MTAIYLLMIAYLVSWFLLLIHCIKRKTFYPIIANSLQTKIFWLVTFVFFNPLLTLLYFIFGFLKKPFPADKQPGLFHTGNVIALVLVLTTVIAVELPLPARRSQPITLTNEDIRNKKSGDPGLSAHLAVIRSRENFNSSHSSSHSDQSTVAARNISIFTETSHPLIDSVARKLQANLLSSPYIDKVTYYPYKTELPSGQILPDVLIRLDIDSLKEFAYPFGRNLSTNIITTITNNAYSNSYTGREGPPLVQFNFNGTLEHKSTLNGRTTRSAKYKLQSEKIAQQIHQQFNGHLNQMIEKYGLAPEMPQCLYGTYHQPPVLAIIDPQNSQTLLSGYGLMTNNQTAWRFTDDRKTVDILKDCFEQLTASGWKGPKEFNPKRHDLSFEKDNASLRIYRQRRPRSNTLSQTEMKPPMIVHYTSRFTDEQYSQAAEKLLLTQLDYQSLFSFKNVFRNANRQDRWFQLIEQFPPTSTEQYLYLAERYLQRDPEKAKTNLIHARVMEYADDKFGSHKQEIKRLAKKLGDESLAETSIAPEVFTRLGFIDIDKIAPPVEYQRQLSQPLSFFKINPDKQIKTLTFIWGPQVDEHGTLSETIITRETGSSSTSRGTVPGGGSDIIGSHFGRIIEHENSFNAKLRIIKPEKPIGPDEKPTLKITIEAIQ